MDQYTYDNWVRVKNKLEELGNTDNIFYKKACEIVFKTKGPITNYLNHKDDSSMDT